jgi:hypothetical protein
MDKQAIRGLIEEMLEFGIDFPTAQIVAPLLLPLIGNPDKLREHYLDLAHRLPHLQFDRAVVIKNLH